MVFQGQSGRDDVWKFGKTTLKIPTDYSRSEIKLVTEKMLQSQKSAKILFFKKKSP